MPIPPSTPLRHVRQSRIHKPLQRTHHTRIRRCVSNAFTLRDLEIISIFINCLALSFGDSLRRGVEDGSPEISHGKDDSGASEGGDEGGRVVEVGADDFDALRGP